MKKPSWEDEIPYDPQTGNIVERGYLNSFVNGSWVQQKLPTMKNSVFPDTLHKFHAQRGGRSAVYVTAESKTIPGRKYYIHLKEFDTFVMLIEKGICMAEFTYCKRGTSIGLKIDDAYARKHIP